MDCKSLDEVRNNIDRIDNEIIKLIAERGGFVKQAAKFKKDKDDVKAPQRVEAIIQKTRQLAEQYGAKPDMIEKLYRDMISGFINLEMNEFADNRLNDFATPPNHIHFWAKKLFTNMGEIIDGSIAYLEKDGGGPLEPHTHKHNHLFIVVKGEARILLNDEVIIVKENNFYLVDGSMRHSVWNNLAETTIMIGISVKKTENASS